MEGRFRTLHPVQRPRHPFGYLNHLYTRRDFEAGLVNLMKDRYESELISKESQIADLRENIKSQQAETSKAKDEVTSALAAMEKLKESFKAKEAGWETEKSALLKRAEDAEAALKPVTEELSGLKQQINIMTSAIFGSRSAKLGSDMRVRLKVVYTLVEQLYTGAQRTIAATMHKKAPSTLIQNTLKQLSVLPKRIEDLKRGAARAGALTALSRAKAWQADLDPEDLANGCPSVKEDGSNFSAEDFAEIARAMRPLESKLADETSLSIYQAAYDADNKKIGAPVHQPTDLIPPISDG